MIDVGFLTKEQAKAKHGITMHAGQNGDKGIKVWLQNGNAFMSQGELLGIAIRKASHAEMAVLDRASVTTEGGVQGDFRGRPGPRQVTVLADEAWRVVCEELGQSLPWTMRRANLLVEGVALEQTVGRRLCVGHLVLEVSGETDPCGRMDQQLSGLRHALEPNWRGGVCCRVIQSGDIRVGDLVGWEGG